MTYGYCTYHERLCDYNGSCIDCPHNTEEDVKWFKLGEESAESEEEAEELNEKACALYKSQDYQNANDCVWGTLEHRQLAEWLKELRAHRKAKEKIEKMDTNYYKHCNGLDMTACAEDFKFEVLRIINECVESELINDEDSD